MITLLFTIAYLVSWVFFHKNQFIERDNSTHSEAAIVANKQWHFWKGLNQIVFFGLMWYSFGLWNALMCATIYWITFDSSMNKFVLNKELFFVGTTSFIDNVTRKIASIFKASPSTTSAILKFTLLIFVIQEIIKNS
jgi:hypothetical protein